MKPICPGCNKELQLINHHHIGLTDDVGYYDDYECDGCALEYLMPEKILQIMGEVVFKGTWEQACRAYKLKVFL